MSYSIVLANQKGGVGKTTSAINIGAAIAEQDKRVLLVDFDPQGNLTSGLNISPSSGKTVYQLISEDVAIHSLIHHTSVGGLHIIPSDIHLSGANVELVKQENREYRLKQKLQPLSDEYDYIIIDSPPSLELLTINGLVAADAVLVPLQCEYFALEGLRELLNSIRIVKAEYNATLSLLGIACTMYDARTKLAQEIVSEVLNYFDKLVFRTVIPRSVRVAEAPSHGIPITQYQSNSIGAISYRALSKEVIERAT